MDRKETGKRAVMLDRTIDRMKEEKKERERAKRKQKYQRKKLR